MKSKYKFAACLAALFVCLVFASVSHSVSVPEKPAKYVVDLAGIVDTTVENRLNGYLQELEQKTTVQFVILTINSLEGESIEDVSINIAHDKWKLGRKEQDNGLLLLISVKDRKYRIEVGYGLEGILPDSLVGSIGRKFIGPFFRKGDYSGGIYAASLAMANEIAADARIKITGMPQVKRSARPAARDRPASLAGTIMTIVVLFIMLILFIKNPRLFLFFLLASSMGGRRGYWGSGGGFGGGGFGSFGGGGGGGFGGGGAGGGW